MKKQNWLALLCACCLLVSVCALSGCGEYNKGAAGTTAGAVAGETGGQQGDSTGGQQGGESETTAATTTTTTTTTTKKPTTVRTAPTKSKYDTMIYRFDFSDYNGTGNEIRQVGETTFRDESPIKVGDKVTISFDYCAMGPTEVRFASDRSNQKWTNNPDYNFEVLQKQGEAPRKGHYKWTFTATSTDVKYKTIRWWFKTYNPEEDGQFYDFYVWNFKITKNSGPNNVRYDVYSQNATRYVSEMKGNADGIEPPTAW